jgi:hypothetical protein
MVLLNTLLAYILIRKFTSSSRTAELQLMLILGILEIYMGSILLSVGILKLIRGYHAFDSGTKSCFASGFIMQWTPRVEICLVTILSLLRYTIVCHQKEKSMRFWLIILFILCLPCTVIYLYGTIRKDSKPTASYIQCQPFLNPDKISSLVLIILSFCFLIPCWITTYCYLAIGWSANKKLNSMQNDAYNTNDVAFSQAIKKEKKKLIIQILFVFCLYNLTFCMSYITMILKYAIGYKRTPIMDAFIYTSVHISMAVNPLITISFQPEVNTEFQVMLVKYQAKFKSIIRRILRNN